MQRGTAVAAARAANALFFFATAAYCLLSYDSFTYFEFIRAEVFAFESSFVTLHPVLFWLVSLITALTLIPAARDPRRRWVVLPYLAASLAVGVRLLEAPLLATVDNSKRSLIVALVTLMFPVWLAVIDHWLAPAPRLRESSEREALYTSGVAALFVWVVYAGLAPVRLLGAAGIHVPLGGLLLSWTASAMLHVMVFAGFFLILAMAGTVGRFAGSPRVEYWLLVAGLAGGIAVILYRLAFAAIALSGPPAAIASVSLGATIAIVWSSLARYRSEHDPPDALDPLDLFLSPIRLVRIRVVTIASWIALPVVAFELPNLLNKFDWDFLFQKLSVLIVWLLAFSLARAFTASRPARVNPRSGIAGILAPAGILAAWWILAAATRVVAARTGDTRLNPEFFFDQYAALDPSFHFIRDVSRSNSGEAADFYTYLKANSALSHVVVKPVEIDFVNFRASGSRLQAPASNTQPPNPGPRPPAPNIFLIVVDSMRRDYLSAYNANVTFTPAIAAFAKESLVFDRVFTRYGATGLSVPAIWAGGMLLHMQYVQPFDPMDSLEKLVDAEGYRRFMSEDAIVSQLMPKGPALTELDRGKQNVEFDLCRTLPELEADLTATRNDPRPVFTYTLPQNVHIANSFTRPVPPGESYPGFFGQVAARVHEIDGCFGQFVDYLKRERLYDNSIVVLMSDHGDSLGEDGRWGHAYTVFPEVMRIPLLIHIPSDLAGRTADLTGLAFSTDVTPTLYALLGYQPADLGPFYGRPLIRLPGEAADVRDRRRESVLLASSYGAVYGMLRHNGRELYIADAVEGRDYAYDLAGGASRRVDITGAMRDLNWPLIRGQIAAISGQYTIAPGK